MNLKTVKFCLIVLCCILFSNELRSLHAAERETVSEAGLQTPLPKGWEKVSSMPGALEIRADSAGFSLLVCKMKKGNSKDKIDWLAQYLLHAVKKEGTKAALDAVKPKLVGELNCASTVFTKKFQDADGKEKETWQRIYVWESKDPNLFIVAVASAPSERWATVHLGLDKLVSQVREE